MASISSCTAAAPPPEMVPVSPAFSFLLFSPWRKQCCRLASPPGSQSTAHLKTLHMWSYKHWTHVLSDITPACVFSLSECVCGWVGVSACERMLAVIAAKWQKRTLYLCLCSVDAGESGPHLCVFAVREAHLPLQPHCDFPVYDYLYSFSSVNPRVRLKWK